MNARLPPQRLFAHSQRGVSLIEFFIAMVLGLVVVAGLLAALLGSGTSSRQLRALAGLTQDAQLALALIARDLQMAGYVEPASVTGAAMTPLRAFRPLYGCDGPFIDWKADFAEAQCAGTAADRHSIEVNYQLPADVVVKTRATAPEPVDCKGVGVERVPGMSTHLVSNRYFVDTPPGVGAAPALYCASNAGTAGSRTRAPLVEQVESLTLRYGVAPAWDAADRSTWRPAYYVGAGELQANPAPVTDWPLKVVAVRVCLVIRSSEEVLAADDSTQYLGCDLALHASTDRRLRRAFFSTVALRNKVN